MAAPLFICWNGLSNALTGTTIVPAVASAATVTPKTMLQVKTGAGKIRIVEWGYILAATPTAPVTMELIETAAIAATVTLGNVLAYNDVTGIASQTAAPGTASTGFTATVEGSVVATRLLAMTYDTAAYFKQQFPLGREPEINGASILRIRATPSTAVAVSLNCYVIWEE
jgi:hypothetical protein